MSDAAQDNADHCCSTDKIRSLGHYPQHQWLSATRYKHLLQKKYWRNKSKSNGVVVASTPAGSVSPLRFRPWCMPWRLVLVQDENSTRGRRPQSHLHRPRRRRHQPMRPQQDPLLCRVQPTLVGLLRVLAG